MTTPTTTVLFVGGPLDGQRFDDVLSRFMAANPHVFMPVDSTEVVYEGHRYRRRFIGVNDDNTRASFRRLYLSESLSDSGAIQVLLDGHRRPAENDELPGGRDTTGEYDKMPPLVTQIDKPPIGLKPRRLHDEQRLCDIEAAILRRKDTGKPVPKEWADEHRELSDKLLQDAKEPEVSWREKPPLL